MTVLLIVLAVLALVLAGIVIHAMYEAGVSYWLVGTVAGLYAVTALLPILYVIMLGVL